MFETHRSRELADLGINAWSACFDDEAQEARFSEARFVGQRRQAVFVTVLIAVAAFAFLPRSIQLYGFSPMGWAMIGLRSLGLLVTAAYVVALHRARPRHADTLTFAWFALFSLTGLAVEFNRPVGFEHMSAADICVVIALLVLIPNRFALQLTAGILFALGHSAVLLSYRWPFGETQDLYVSFILVGVVVGCGYTSWLNHVNRRTEFWWMRKEQELSMALQRALGEVRTLKGLLPICACCKAVRKDETHWQAIEAYVVENSDAEFTHGLCPECARERYGEVLTEEDIRLA